MSTRTVWTVDDLLALGVRTDLVTACAAVLGVKKSQAWELYHRGELPFPTIRCGRRVVVPTRALLELLRLTPDTSEGRPARRPTATTENPSQGVSSGNVPHPVAG